MFNLYVQTKMYLDLEYCKNVLRISYIVIELTEECNTCDVRRCFCSPLPNIIHLSLAPVFRQIRLLKHIRIWPPFTAHRSMSGYKSSYDVVIAGGSVMGLSSAYFIKQMSPTTSVCVVERDSTVSRARLLALILISERILFMLEN